jgi:hypothetical protein
MPARKRRSLTPAERALQERLESDEFWIPDIDTIPESAQFLFEGIHDEEAIRDRLVAWQLWRTHPVDELARYLQDTGAPAPADAPEHEKIISYLLAELRAECGEQRAAVADYVVRQVNDRLEAIRIGATRGEQKAAIAFRNPGSLLRPPGQPGRTRDARKLRSSRDLLASVRLWRRFRALEREVKAAFAETKAGRGSPVKKRLALVERLVERLPRGGFPGLRRAARDGHLTPERATRLVLADLLRETENTISRRLARARADVEFMLRIAAAPAADRGR